MANEKKFYEEPEVTLVQFDYSDRITASAPCVDESASYGGYLPLIRNGSSVYTSIE